MKQTILIKVDVKTKSDIESVKTALNRGIYKSLCGFKEGDIAEPDGIDVTFNPLPWAVSNGPEGDELGCYCATEYASIQIAFGLQEMGYSDAMSVKTEKE
jgi:rhodanese-related sulfurtransferase